MRQVGKAFISHRAVTMNRYDVATLEQLIEHSQTPGVQGKDQTPESLTPRLCGVQKRRIAEKPMADYGTPHN
jgi:hypothetical protein